MRLTDRARGRFAEQFGGDADRVVAFAPGRVNLIGEHTDYNDGFVLPVALDRGVAIAFRRREIPAGMRGADPGQLLCAKSGPNWSTGEAVLGRIKKRDIRGWFSYVAGVAWALNEVGRGFRGIDLQIASDLPAGAGLSSSAALELATARALIEAEEGAWDPIEMARLCRRAENEFVGVPCGIMDQFASAASQAGSVTLLDCRSMQIEPVPIPNDVTIVVMDTGVHRSLARSAYQTRRASCAAAVKVFQALYPTVTALRDVDHGMLDAVRGLLDPTIARRAQHVIDENARVLATVAALRAGDVAHVGHLMNESHESLRGLYEVTGPELDLAVEVARRHPACLGARMTGAGFGGCAIALVRATEGHKFLHESHAAFARKAARAGEFFVCRPAAGARLVE